MQALRDYLGTTRAIQREDERASREHLIWLAEYCEVHIAESIVMHALDDARRLAELHKEVLHTGAKYIFDMFLQYVEWEREPRKRFYLPRRKILRQVVDALQELADLDIELLAI
jgi:hypothetical protein